MAFLNSVRGALTARHLLTNSLKLAAGHFNGATGTIHTSSVVPTFRRTRDDKGPFPEPKRWPDKNLEVHPPQEQTELRRRAEYNHHRANVKYSPKKMWYICCLVRGLSVDEAIKQLSFVAKKGAVIMKEMIEEAREIAIREHGFEYKSNMFIGECNSSKGLVVKGYRKHARYRFGEVRYFHVHLYVRLVEGPPPAYFYHPVLTNRDKLDHYIDDLRKRNIKFSAK